MTERTGARPRRSGRVLSAVLFLAAIGAVAALVQSSSGQGRAVSLRQAQPQAAGTAAPSDLTARGRRVFLRDCAWCHGPQGQGTQYAPEIADKGTADVDFWLSTGRMPLKSPTQPVRPGPPAYSRSTIDGIVAYVGSIGTGPAVPVVRGGDAAKGRSLFIENCAPCHSSSGTGMIVPGGGFAPALFGDDRTQVVEAMRLGPGHMPPFARTQLDDQQAADVATYVQQLGDKQNRGGAPIASLGPIPEGFIALAIGLPLLVVVIRLLGRKAPK